jgi:hypothetical protein
MVSRSRSTSRSSAASMIHDSTSIRSGSSGDRTDRCATRRTRPGTTRTSSMLSSSHLGQSRPSGCRCGMSSGSGRASLCAFSGSTTRTPSRCVPVVAGHRYPLRVRRCEPPLRGV